MSSFPPRRAGARALLTISLFIVFAGALFWAAGRLLTAKSAGSSSDAAVSVPVATLFTVNSVNDNADSNVGDGHCDTDGNLGNGDQCTLRAAIQEGAATNQGHLINFNLLPASVITLNTALPGFVGDVSITGPGSNQLTVQRSTAGGTPNFRIFFFVPIGGTFNVLISGLTIANGINTQALTPSGPEGLGGCIFNMNPITVTLTDMIVRAGTSQKGGGIYNGGTMTLTNGTVTSNTASSAGGGIYNTGTLTFTDSTVSDNVVIGGSGGGMTNAGGTANVTRSTVSGNNNGGISNENTGATFTLTNSTVSGNVAFLDGEGGIKNSASGAVLTLSNTTVTANTGFGFIGTGGIRNDQGTVNLGNSIVAKNTGALNDLRGTFVSQGYNLIGLSSGDGLANGLNHDQVGVSGAPIDPLLGPLANNGGGTRTHAPLGGSPAIDAGNSSLTSDQRGMARPVDDPSATNAGGNAADIGAYETNLVQVNTIVDADDGACSALGTGNGCTLREAIIAANAATSIFSDISFAPALTSAGPATIDLLIPLPALSSGMKIQGPSSNLLTIRRSTAGGTPDFRIFTINPGKTVNISGLTITNGNQGGIRNNEGVLAIDNCVITGNSGAAGVFNSGARLTMDNSTIIDNTSGGIDNQILLQGANPSIPSFLTVNNSTISGNSSATGFGGIQNLTASNGTATAIITNSTISGNTTNGDDAAGIKSIAIIGGTATLLVTNSTVYGNVANGSSGVGGISRQVSCVGGCTVNVKLRNTIVAGNLRGGSTPSDLSSNAGVVDSSSSFNLIGTGGSAGLSNGVNGNQVGVADAKLGPLANNGGPTQTHALLSTSPALDAGENCVAEAPHCSEPNVSRFLTDQRGYNRLVDGPDANISVTVDIGAFEAQRPLADLPDSSINEDTSLTVFFDPGDTSNITSITASSSNGTLVPNDSAHLNASLTGSSGNVVINPAANLFGTSDITVIVNRSGGGSDSRTFVLTVNSSNDAPSFTPGQAQIVNEDAGPQTVNNWATGISPGPVNESGQVVNFQVTGNTNAALFSAAPVISSTGTLTYTPVANASGSATITIKLQDFSGTANGGVDTSAPHTFTITVNAVNDPPSFIKGDNQTINEDTGSQTLINWATSISAGPANESQTLAFQITDNSNPGLFSAGPAISPTGTLTYAPAANANGSATITVVLKDSGGTANGGVDTSPAQTFMIGITSVNDVPSFTKGADQTVNEDAGGQSVTGWATAVSAGAANESGQTLAFQVTNNSNAGLFSVAPAINSDGTLTYTPAADVTGSATITINLKDNGGTANGGVDTSANQSFSITVNSVNDAPSFIKGADQTVNEDSGAQTVVSWASGMSAGPANESAQILTFSATNDNNGLFSAQPAISATGTLTYTSAANANGTATVSVTLRDDGGTANGGLDTTVQTFTLAVNAINDAPSFTKGADQTVNNTAGAQSVANWATAVSAGPADESSQLLTFQVTSNTNPSLFTSGPAVSSNGTLTYTPAANAAGTATININLKDDGGTTNGGVDTSASQSFNITVNAAGGTISFASATVNAAESSGATTVTVNRTGDTTAAANVDYATSADNGLPCSTANGVATPKCDFTGALGTLNFTAAETSKTITIPLSQDSFVEGPETFTITLSNPSAGAILGATPTSTITIADDATEPSTNVIDDARNFVRQHYHDFLNREPDTSGWDFWTNQITSCGSDAQCAEVRRVDVSASFFLSIEFQQSGYLVERFYKTGYGDATGTSQFQFNHQLPVPVVRFSEFLKDTQRMGQGVIVLAPGWEQALENNKLAYALEFVQTTRFTTALPTTLTPTQFVDRLNQNTGGVLSLSERTTAINLFGVAANSSNVTARAQAVRQVAEDTDLYSAEYNRAFVLAEYFGYLRRNPNDAPESTLDYTGYDFWLTKLNQFNGNYVNAEMVKAFLSSIEYRQRFGP